MGKLVQQNIGRVNHVVIIVHEENFEKAAKAFTELLDLDFEGPYDSKGGGMYVYIDLSAGIEIVAPYNREIATRHFDHLEKHGEGVFNIAFGVKDRDEAVRRAESLGFEIWRWANGFDVNPAWKEDIEVFDEAALTPLLHGTRLKFAEVVPKSSAAE